MPRAPAIKPYGPENTAEIQRDFRFQGYIEGEEHRGVSLWQLERIAEWSQSQCFRWREQLVRGSVPAPSVEQLTVQDVVKWMVGPGTREKACAFVELLTDQRQTPVWFVSHAWSGTLSNFLQCVQLHYQTRVLGEVPVTYDSPYWVCAFAIREHALDKPASLQAFKDGPERLGFYQAIHLCKGMLVVLGSSLEGSARPFTRMWCALEMSVAADCAQSRGSCLLLDLAVEHNSQTELLTAGMTERESEMEVQKAGTGTWAKECREKNFPLDILQEGLSLQLTPMELNETDYEVEVRVNPPEGDLTTKVKITYEQMRTDYRSEMLKYIAGCLGSSGEPPVEHDNYSALNLKVRAEFALAGWRRALLQGIDAVESFNLPAVLRRDIGRQLLILDYFGFEEMSDREIVSIAKGLPPCLAVVELNFVRCSAINDRGVMALAAGLPASTRNLLLDFSYCGVLSDASLKALAGNMPPSIESLRLRFKGAKGNITDSGLEALSNSLPQSLNTLELDFATCEGIGQKGLDALSAKLPRALRSLHLDFWMCGAINNDGGIHGDLGGIQMLSECFPQRLDSLQLRFTGIHGDFSDKGVRCISENLPQGLKILHLDLLYLDRLGDAGLDKLGKHLPANLHTFKLKVEGCDRIGNAGLSFVCDKMKSMDLHTLAIHCEFCGQITSKGVSDMAGRLPDSLRSLSLNFGSCKEIKDDGLIALAEKLPGSLEKFHLDLKYCKKVGDAGVAALGKNLPASLTSISLLFGDCELIYDAGIVALAKGLPETIEWLEINLCRCKNVGDAGVLYIAKHFPPACKNLLLNVDGTKVSPEKRAYCTGVDAMRRCTPTASDLSAPLCQPDRFVPTTYIGWLRRHGPNVAGVDEALAKGDPILEHCSNTQSGQALLSKLDVLTNSRSPMSSSQRQSPTGLRPSPTGSMSKSQSLPSLVRKKPPIAMQNILSKPSFCVAGVF